jgi:hypothetical protein
MTYYRPIVKESVPLALRRLELPCIAFSLRSSLDSALIITNGAPIAGLTLAAPSDDESDNEY